jgi:hypothetical protein
MWQRLVWVLLGTNCDYYHSLQKIYTMLGLKEVYALKAKFTPENCCCITWVVLDDRRAFFDNVETTRDFQGPEHIVFTQLYMINILKDIQYAIPIKHASFPNE